jgi:hypothetical protein
MRWVQLTLLLRPLPLMLRLSKLQLNLSPYLLKQAIPSLPKEHTLRSKISRRQELDYCWKKEAMAFAPKCPTMFL